MRKIRLIGLQLLPLIILLSQLDSQIHCVDSQSSSPLHHPLAPRIFLFALRGGLGHSVAADDDGKTSSEMDKGNDGDWADNTKTETKSKTKSSPKQRGAGKGRGRGRGGKKSSATSRAQVEEASNAEDEKQSLGTAGDGGNALPAEEDKKKSAAFKPSKKCDLQSKQWAKDAIAATAGFEYVRRTLPDLPPSAIPNKDDDPRFVPVKPKGLRKVWHKVEKSEEGTAGARLSGLSVFSKHVDEQDSHKGSKEKLSRMKQVKHVVRISGLRRHVQDNSFDLHPYANSSVPEAEHEETLAAKRSKAPPKAVDSSEDAQKVEVAEGEESEAGLKEGEEDIKSETGPLEISE